MSRWLCLSLKSFWLARTFLFRALVQSDESAREEGTRALCEIETRISTKLLASNLENYFSISTSTDGRVQAWRFFTNPADKKCHKFENDSIAVPILNVYSLLTRTSAYQHWINDFFLDNRLFVFAFGLTWTWRTMNSAAQLSFDWTKIILMWKPVSRLWGSKKEKMNVRSLYGCNCCRHRRQGWRWWWLEGWPMTQRDETPESLWLSLELKNSS